MTVVNFYGITTMLNKIDIFVNNVVIIQVKDLDKKIILYRVYIRT